MSPPDPALQPPASLYIHIPFCAHKCPYCDFYSLPGRDDLVAPYVSALETEITLAAEMLRPDASLKPVGGAERGTSGAPSGPRLDDLSHPFRTVFIGGGTPTILAPEQIHQILDVCRARLGVAPDAEVTIECNPGTVTASDLLALRDAGVNRLSIGVQSLDDDELAFLQRVHSAAEAEATVGAAHDAGFDDVSLDLMYCLPGQTPKRWRETLCRAAALDPSHVSAYALTVEEETPLWALVDAGEVEPMPEELQADLFMLTSETLTELGFEHYEISNFARPGRRCRHNLTYWRNEPYLGLGAAAWSFVGGQRRCNVADVEAYSTRLASDGLAIDYAETCTGAAAANETLMMGLRLKDGISLQALNRRHGVDLLALRGDQIRRFVGEGISIRTADRLGLTLRGMCVASEITTVLALAEEECGHARGKMSPKQSD